MSNLQAPFIALHFEVFRTERFLLQGDVVANVIYVVMSSLSLVYLHDGGTGSKFYKRS